MRALTFCGDLGHEAMSAVASIVSRIEVPAHALLAEEGERSPYVYNVTAGTAKLYKSLPDGRTQVLGFLLPGDFLGLGDDRLGGLAAESLTRVSVCRFRRRDFENLQERIPVLGRRLLSLAQDEIARSREQMLLLGRKSARERLASFLLGLYDRLEARGEANDPLPLPMTRTDIGDYLGLTIETVSRTLAAFKRDGIISLDGVHAVRLLDPERMRSLATGDEADRMAAC
ncbi:helix-turn-helix domain-containing protein [Tistrella mobilis]|uniref:helix-turn-helix domain-containing protein n=1 Tax=Tistrella mobilis TaxID=171437 RepID=UPI0031F63E86